MDDTKIPSPFRIEHLCYLPMNLARTELAVRPCVALLHATQPPVPTSAVNSSAKSSPRPSSSASATPEQQATVEDTLIPRLDAKEVAAVFSAPFHNFLKAEDEVPGTKKKTKTTPALPPGKWYEGEWIQAWDEPWRAHYFYVPVHDQRVMKPRKEHKSSSHTPEIDSAAAVAVAAQDDSKKDNVPVDELDESGRYKVWGMTARMLVDAATIAYGEKPEFEHNNHYGDEKLILGLETLGRLGPKGKADGLLTAEHLKKANDAGSKM